MAWVLAAVALCIAAAALSPTNLMLGGRMLDSRAAAAEANQPRGLLARDPADALAVSFERPHLVFDPEEKFQATVLLNLFEPREAADKPVRAALKWKVVPAGSSRSIAEGLVPVSAFVNPTRPAGVALELRVPRDEGVYNLRLSATGRGFTAVERVVQLVVVERARREEPSAASASESIVDSFEPASAGLFRKVTLNASRQRPGSSLSRMLKLKSGRDEPDGDATTEMNPLQVAYKLRVAHPGHAHRLELSLPRGTEQWLSIGIVQSDEQGQLVSAGPDSTIAIEPRQPAEASPASTASGDSHVHRQIFWPRDREPLLVIASRRPGQAATISHVALYDLGETLPAETRGRRDLLPAPPDARSGPRARLVGRYLHKPRLAENFGAPRSFDNAERCSLDDWQTFLLAGTRVTEYLRCEQHSALMLAVLADGATIYPSRLIEPSLVHDNGRLARSGQDPTPKDILELVLRLFDRANLALVAEFQFDSQLPALERLLDSQAASSGDVLLVDGTGASAGGTHLYNVLSPRVQRAVLDVVQELLERYKGHPALAGVAFELHPDSFLQLPGIEWGYDLETLRRFEHDTQTRLPPREGDEWRSEAFRYLTTTARREWLRFRCAEVARFHKKLADLVARELPQGRVIFSSHLAPLGDSNSEAAAIEAVRSGGSPGQLLLGQGLDFSLVPYVNERHVTVLRPLIQNDAADRLGQAALATLNNSPAIDALYRGGSRGGLVCAVTGADSEASLGTPAASDAKSPSSPPNSLPHADGAARRYAHLLATLDAQVVFDGGSTFPLILDDALGRMRRMLGNLPDLPFRPAGPQVQPVVVRAAQAGNATWLYAVNDSSLPLTAELILDCPSGTACLALEAGEKLPLENVSGPSARSRLRLALAGNSFAGCRLERAGVEVLEVRLALPEGLLAPFQNRIDSLSERMNAITQLARSSSKSLSNPGFEQPATEARSIPGWELPVEHAAWSLDDENPRSGSRSLRLSAEGESCGLESPELPLEGSRFVTMSLWMRSNRASARVQMQFEATIGGEAFRHQTVVETGKAWRQYVFQVDELPVGPIEKAHLRVGAVDSCKLWIDDVEIDAQSFSPDEVRQLTKTLSSVKLAWKEGRYADCQRLLDGYWGQLLVTEPVAPLEVSPARPRLGERLKNMFRRQ
jgi:hypothetical protein